MTDDNEVMTGGAEFTAEEQAYFDNRGAIPAQAPKPEAEEAAQQEAEPSAALKEAVEEGERLGKGRLPKTVVPHAALEEERGFRKAAEERARSLELENARAIARLEALLEANKPKEEAKEPAEPPKRPRADEDVFGTADAAYDKAESLEQRLEEIGKANEEQRQHQALISTVSQKVQAFAKQTPDYPDALDHMRNARAEELRLWGATDEQITQTIAREEIQFARAALSRGLDPARVAYETALRRGYTKKAAAPAADPGESDAVKKLDTVAAGQKAGQSLSGTGGGAPTGGLSAKDILSMSDDEFLAFEANSKNAAKVRRLMGGR